MYIGASKFAFVEGEIRVKGYFYKGDFYGKLL